MPVIGTAGHVDHGKSTLVRALTGIDPDRLKEEREREMTIDLGFAWLSLPSGREVSVVDVPGHEDFIKNMLAGVGGIDLVLFVVAADEGVMPQTREHLAIVDLLQINSGVVALTKSDLAEDPEWLEMVVQDVHQALAGSVLQDSAIIPVSARSGQGLGDLIAEIDRLAGVSSVHAADSHPRLPVDRVFTMPGFGTVVTGTLTGGSLHVGQEVEILPQVLKARIRGLQAHKAKIDRALPPTRLAVNLTGISLDEVERGNVLTTPNWLRPTQMVDGRLRVWRDVPEPLPNSAVVDFFTGTSRAEARVRLLDANEIDPGHEGWAQLILSAPVCVVKGDRFIIRQASPSLTLGGGTIVDPSPTRQHRRFRPEVLQRMEQLARGTPEEVLLQELAVNQPIEANKMVTRSALGTAVASETLVALLHQGAVVPLGPVDGVAVGNVPTSTRYIMTAVGWEALWDKLSILLTEYHRAFPLRSGMPREELRQRTELSPRVFNDAVSRAAALGTLTETEAIVRLASHRVVLDVAQTRKVETLLRAFGQNPYSPPSLADCETSLGAELLASVIEQGQLIKISDSVVLDADTYQRMTQAIVDYLRLNGRITLAQVRDLFSTSRKYAQAILEHLDEKRVTKRIGDERVLLH
jgi:selenocysteine-specific elongation factor